MATRPLCRLTWVTSPRTSHFGSLRRVCRAHAESFPPLHQSQTGWLRAVGGVVCGTVAAILRCAFAAVASWCFAVQFDPLAGASGRFS